MDTLKELADLIDTNKDAITALQSLAAGHVKYDGAQSLTTAQQTQARTNIGAASATELASVKTTAEKGVSDAATAKSTADSALSKANTAQSTANTAVSNAATAQAKADAVGTELTNFKAEVGSTSTDYVAVYTAARDGTV